MARLLEIAMQRERERETEREREKDLRAPIEPTSNLEAWVIFSNSRMCQGPDLDCTRKLEDGHQFLNRESYCISLLITIFVASLRKVVYTGRKTIYLYDYIVTNIQLDIT